MRIAKAEELYTSVWGVVEKIEKDVKEIGDNIPDHDYRLMMVCFMFRTVVGVLVLILQVLLWMALKSEQGR